MSQKASASENHISVCVCTYKRLQMLRRLLDALNEQETENRFTFSIVVADNDRLASSRPVVEAFAVCSKVPATYCVEPRQSICLARNEAIRNATGNFIAFIDDDEFPARDWLLRLFYACENQAIDGVLGPVLRHFDAPPPKWILKGDFYVRPRHQTGFVMPWREGRTGNVLLKKRILSSDEAPFEPEGHRGKDVEFFRRMMERGHVFIWCDEAVVYESVPPSRWSRKFMLKRALIRGKIAVQRDGCSLAGTIKSLVAVSVYGVALPFALILGQHRFMYLLIRLCDHLGKLSTLVGLAPIKNEYATD